MVAILSPSVYTVKSVDIYKSFGFDDGRGEGLALDEEPEFSLLPVTEVYSDVNSGKEVYFLNALNEPVRVKSITKEEQEFDYEGICIRLY